MRNTPLKKGRWILLKFSSIVTAIDMVKIHTSIIKSNMIAPCMSNRDTSGLWYFHPRKVSRDPSIKPKTTSHLVYEWSSCLWLNFVDVCSSFWVVHLHYMCICYGIITLSITQRDSPMLSRNSWTNVALHFWGIPQFMWLVSTEFPINLDSTFPSIQWILNAYPQHEGETCAGIGK